MGEKTRKRRSPATSSQQRTPPPAIVEREADPAVRRIVAAALAVVVLGVYIATLSPTVAGGDSGELITVAYTLGVAHPPGYPLYTVIGKLFTLLPIGTIAWRVNLFSAVSAAGAAALLFLAVARWCGNLWSAAAAASLFAFSPRVWPHAVTAEVFALNNCFVAGLVYLTVRFDEAVSVRVAAITFLWIGLGLSNHHTLVFYAIPAALFVLIQGGPKIRAPRVLATCALCGLLGLLPYLYIPWASARVPLMSWGDQTTVSGFLTHLLRREYGTFQLGIQEQGPGGVLMQRLQAYIAGSFVDLLWIGPVLALAGIVLSRNRSRRLTWCWAGGLLLYLIVFNNLANGALQPGVSRFIEGRFWQQAHLVICAFCGLGLAALGTRVQVRNAVPIVAAALVLAQPATQFRAEDHRRHTDIHTFVKAILDSLPPNALLIETGDYVFYGLRYLQIVEHERPDVRVLDQMLLAYPWHERLARKYFAEVALPGTRLLPRPARAGDYGMKALLDANNGRAPIFFCDVSLWEDALETYAAWPSGLVDHIQRKPQEPSLATWIEAGRASFGRVDPESLAVRPPDSWERVALRYFWKQAGKHALALGRWGQEHAGNVAALTRSAELMELILARNSDAPHGLHRDLGIVYQQLARSDPSFQSRMRKQFEMYLAGALPTDPDVPAIRQILGQGR